MESKTEQAFEYLKGKGKLSGGFVREALGFSKTEWKSVKEELKLHNLVILGRGRGGTIELVSEDKPIEPKEPTKVERMAFAREAKQVLTQVQKQRDKIRDKATALGKKGFPDTQLWAEVLNVETGECIVYVRDDDIPGWQAYRCHV